MTNDDIINIGNDSFQVLETVIKPFLILKDADFKVKMDSTLKLLDREAYSEETRKGIKLFYKTLSNTIDE